jgi:transposase-like protein
MRTARSLLLLPLAALLLLTGCRTYGDSGYEAGPKMYRQMQQAVRQSENDLNRARANLQSLQQAADTNAALQPMLERFRENVERHATIVADHRQMIDGLSASSSYRTLHRAFGAITTDERVIGKVYDRTIRRIDATVRGVEVEEGEPASEATYFTEPAEYRREANARNRLTMEEALRP